MSLSNPSSNRPTPLPQTLLSYYHAMRQRWGDLHWWPGDTPLEVAVGAVLTQNTAWTNVEKAMGQLKQAHLLPETTGLRRPSAAEQAICARRMHAMGPAGLAPLIRPSGYFNIKAKRLWNLLDWLVTGYQGDLARLEAIPTAQLRQELLGVSGIGQETADSILLYALARPVFVIDAYTHRITKRHGLARRSADYAAIQQMFLSHLPADRALFNDYHAQLVMVGKDYCKPTPRCEQCPLRPFLPRGGPRVI